MNSITADMRNTLSNLDKLNSSFPDTKAFLKAKGVELVSELNESDNLELQVFLKGVLSDILQNKSA